MAYDSTKPADDGYLANAPSEIRNNTEGLRTGRVVDAGSVQGLVPGNASGNIPISNGTLNTNLNADKLDGYDGTYYAPATHTHNTATSSSNGFMSNTDKAKLDTIATGAEVNQNAFSNVLVGSTTIQADSKTDTLEIVPGANIAVTPDATNDRITIAVAGKVPSAANADYATAAGAAGDANTVDGKHASDITNDAINWVKGYGLGNYGNSFSGNIDQTNWYTGFYYVVSAATGTKPSSYGHMIVIVEHPANTIKQIWLTNTTNDMQIRQCVNGIWSAWKQIATTDGAVSNSDKVDGYHAGTGANQVLVLDASGKVPSANGGVPSGIICMWSGSASNIPSGWALCDGTNGTPDLRDRFIVGAGNSYAVGATGGEATHTLTISEMPSHNHSPIYGEASENDNGTVGPYIETAYNNPYGVVEFSKSSTGYTGGNQPHENRPPYYALCFIMKL